MKIFLIGITSFLVLSSSITHAAICLPCDPCWISGVGGPITDMGSVADMVSKGISEAEKQYNFYEQQVNATVNDAISKLQSGATSVLDEIGISISGNSQQSLDLYKNNQNNDDKFFKDLVE